MRTTISSTGSFNNLEGFLTRSSYSVDNNADLEAIGMDLVAALALATPIDTGETASSWSYKVSKTAKGAEIAIYNSDMTEDGVPIPILIQYGHGTGTGGYVPPRDFINPAIKPIYSRASSIIERRIK